MPAGIGAVSAFDNPLGNFLGSAGSGSGATVTVTEQVNSGDCILVISQSGGGIPTDTYGNTYVPLNTQNSLTNTSPWIFVCLNAVASHPGANTITASGKAAYVHYSGITNFDRGKLAGAFSDVTTGIPTAGNIVPTYQGCIIVVVSIFKGATASVGQAETAGAGYTMRLGDGVATPTGLVVVQDKAKASAVSQTTAFGNTATGVCSTTAVCLI